MERYQIKIEEAIIELEEKLEELLIPYDEYDERTRKDIEDKIKKLREI